MKRGATLAGGLAVLMLGGCAKKQAIAPVPVPPRPVATPQPRIQRPRAPAAQQPAAVPVPAPPKAVPQRAPLTLESSNDPLPERSSVESTMRDAQGLLAQLNRRNLTGTASEDRKRIVSMLDLAQQAFARGDLRQANDLSGRAAVLARTLLNAK